MPLAIRERADTETNQGNYCRDGVRDKYADDLKQPGTVNPIYVVRGQPHKSEKLCYRCGGKHKATACPFKKEECHACRKKGHIAKVCRTELKKHSVLPKSEQTHRVDTQESEPVEYTIFKVSSHTSKPVMVEVTINEQPLQMELDTSASISLISEHQYKQLHETPSLEKSSVILRTYTGENLSTLGSIRATATCNNQTKTLPILVIKGNGPNLMDVIGCQSWPLLKPGTDRTGLKINFACAC